MKTPLQLQSTAHSAILYSARSIRHRIKMLQVKLDILKHRYPELKSDEANLLTDVTHLEQAINKALESLEIIEFRANDLRMDHSEFTKKRLKREYTKARNGTNK